jgi:hypothetical protein
MTAYVLLMANTGAQPNYQVKMSFLAAAGIADFDPTRTANMSTGILTLIIMDFAKLLSDLMDSIPLSPHTDGQGHCHDPELPGKWTPCDAAYFLPGGMELVSPLIDNFTIFPEATVYVVPKTRGYHVEFGSIGSHQMFRSRANCAVYGSENAAIQLCFASGANGNILYGEFGQTIPLGSPNMRKTRLIPLQKL